MDMKDRIKKAFSQVMIETDEWEKIANYYRNEEHDEAAAESVEHFHECALELSELYGTVNSIPIIVLVNKIDDCMVWQSIVTFMLLSEAEDNAEK